MDLPTALAYLVRHVLLPTRRRVLRAAGERGHPLQAWASIFGFGRPTGIDVGPGVRRARCRRPSGGRQHFKTEIDKLWKPGDSIQLAIGQEDLLVTPLQMARFYALIANGGKLVTPHLLLDVEQSDRRRRAASGRARAAAGRHRPGRARDRPAGAARGDARVRSGRRTPSSATSRSSIAGKTGTAEKAVDPGDGIARLFNQSWWCGYGPYDNADARRLRADRERRPRRHRRGAGGAEGVRAVLPREGAQSIGAIHSD